MKSIETLFYSIVAAAACLFSTSCGSTKGDEGPIHITKVNPFHYKPGNLVKTDDKMIRFEQRHHTYGAVETDDFKEKYGNHYTVFWETDNPGTPVTVRFHYYQSNTGAQIHTIDASSVPKKKKNTTKFRVHGEHYETNGPVTAWKVDLIQNGSVVAEFKSFLWK